MPKYQLISETVDVFQMTKSRRLDNSEWPEWLNKAWSMNVTDLYSVFCSSDGTIEGDPCTPLFLNTHNGVILINWGDIIICYPERGGGELSVRKPDDFMLRYVRVEVPELLEEDENEGDS